MWESTVKKGDQFSAVATIHVRVMVIADVVKLSWIWIHLKLKLKKKRICCVSGIHKERPESATMFRAWATGRNGVAIY